MYAVIEIAGQQFKVEKGAQIVTPRLDANNGDKLEFDNVLLTSDETNVNIGNPVVEAVKVMATKIGDERGKKVIIFKKKRRKGYKLTRGHRQDYTRLQIDDIVIGGGA